jgi:hypothetical protein
MASAISRLFGPPQQTPNVPLIVGTSVATTLAVVTVARLALQGKQQKIIKSPRYTLLPNLTEKEKDDLPYPPNLFPGARDVDSPVRCPVVLIIVTADFRYSMEA